MYFFTCAWTQGAETHLPPWGPGCVRTRDLNTTVVTDVTPFDQKVETEAAHPGHGQRGKRL